jgi:hypothetical protein
MNFNHNNNLNFFGYPEKKEVFGLSLDETKALLDLFTMVCIKLLIGISGLKRTEISILKPFNLLIGYHREYLAFGISNDKAIRGLTSLSTMNIEIRQPLESNLNEVSFGELGYHITDIVKFNKEIIMNNKPFLQEYISTLRNNGKNIKVPEQLLINLTVGAEQYRKQLFERRNSMVINPVFKTKNITIDNNLCFTLLPFNKNQIEIFNDIINPTIEDEFNMQVLRANDIFGTNEIMEDIWTYICKAKFLIADITGKNPNVFYELGICHTVGKEVIVICEADSYESDYEGKFPFDIAHRRVVVYKNTGPGMLKFKQELINTIRAINGENEIDK